MNANWNILVAIKTLAVDNGGLLHLCGNMHARPLVYWRTTEPFYSDRLKEEGINHIETLEEINYMVGENEDRVTYEGFQELPDGRLVFSYRYGGSGDGKTIINVWNPKKKIWKRLQDKPLFDGLGKMNAYGRVYGSAMVGPDGNFHRIFMWRETPDARTNRYLSYVWSEDMDTGSRFHATDRHFTFN